MCYAKVDLSEMQKLLFSCRNSFQFLTWYKNSQ